jgi:GH15 family glucan-1,4-alpha-glucosidase
MRGLAQSARAASDMTGPASRDPAHRPIGSYAVIGDLRSAALVGSDGAIDWLCLPCFDSPACFAALLGNEDNGRWQIAPAAGVERCTRAYRPSTLVLDTTFQTATGSVTVSDCMDPMSARPRLLRIVHGVGGSVDMRMHLKLRFDYGSIVPWVEKIENGIGATAGPDSVLVRSSVPMRGEDLSTVSQFRVAQGDTVAFELAWHPSHADAPPMIDAVRECERVTAWWQAWSARFRYEGEWREDILRSLITLKSLTFAETGGIVAAPTTSLPEQPGGVRNWDYRCCWLRDAAFTLYAMLRAGYHDEAAAWREWLLRAAAGRPEELSILCGVRGERRLTEIELPWLAGFEGSRPVRIGNAASTQFQLDVYGEVMDTLHLAQESGLGTQERAWGLQRVFLDFLESAWSKPDNGIWEMRGPQRQFTYSKVMAWVAFDRAIQAVERHGLPGPVEHWRATRTQIHDEVCRRGFHAGRGAFVQSYDGDLLDASALLLPRVGFLPARDPRMRSTIEVIARELTADGFVLRYQTERKVDGLPPGEGVFLPCSFWLCNDLALIGETKRARELFERLLELRNDVGLLSEEYDPGSRQLIGNFPQALSHVALINTAMGLSTGQRAPSTRSD